MTLKDTYQAVLAVATRAEDLRFEEREGKLQITGVVATEEQKNRIWAAIRTVPAWQREVVVNLRVQPKSAAARTSSRAGASGASQTHTVVAGDTLSAIADTDFKMTDFGITPPDVSLAKSENGVHLQIRILAKLAPGG